VLGTLRRGEINNPPVNPELTKRKRFVWLGVFGEIITERKAPLFVLKGGAFLSWLVEAQDKIPLSDDGG